MVKYDVYLETRQSGAQGVYAVDKFTIDAESEGQAIRIATTSAHNVHNLETRFPRKVCLHDTGEDVTGHAKFMDEMAEAQKQHER